MQLTGDTQPWSPQIPPMCMNGAVEAGPGLSVARTHTGPMQIQTGGYDDDLAW